MPRDLLSRLAVLSGVVAAAALAACGDGSPEGARDARVGEPDAGPEVVDSGAEPDAGDPPDGPGAPEDAAAPADAAEPQDAEAPWDAEAPPDAGAPDAAGDAAAPQDVVPTPGDVDACPPGDACTVPFMAFCEQGRCNAQGVCVVQPIPGCCVQEADCAAVVPNGPCKAVRCVGNQCASVPRPGCCLDDADCADDVACSVGQCSEAGRCVHCPVDCACPAQPYPLALDFSAATTLAQLGLFQVDYKANDGVAWQLDQRRAARPPGALYLGNPQCRTYFNGALGPDCQPLPGAVASQVRLDLYGPVLTLPHSSAGHVGLVWVWADVEPPSPSAPLADALQIFAQDLLTGFEWPLASTVALGKSTGGSWRLLAFDLSPWRGATMRLRFAFDTLDGQDNHHEGVYLDELTVVDRCLGGCCEVDADCAGLALPDACSEARCVTLDDGAGRFCAVVPKSPGVACEPCTSDADCADANPCTVDVCAPDGTCAHDAFCCFEQVLFADGFEAGLEAWFVETAGGPVLWRTVPTAQAWEGARVAAFVDASGTYGPGPSAGVLRSGVLDLPPALEGPGQLEVAFQLRLETEWDGVLYDNPLGLDRLSLEVVSAGLPTEVWSSDEVFGTTGGQWLPVAVSLEPWAGKSMQLRFRFDSVDDTANAFAGPWIDALEVRRGCP